jgi:prolipoprotein diacylglyceryltransferase
VILAYALIYSVVRFAVEFVRDDPRGDLLGLTTLTGLSTSQMISLLVGISALITLVVRWRKFGSEAKGDRLATPKPARA